VRPRRNIEPKPGKCFRVVVTVASESIVVASPVRFYAYALKHTTETSEPGGTKVKNPHAVALGRIGGLKGGKARAEALTASERRRIARKAALARWAKKAKD
jgi:hypothetical protein